MYRKISGGHFSFSVPLKGKVSTILFNRPGRKLLDIFLGYCLAQAFPL